MFIYIKRSRNYQLNIIKKKKERLQKNIGKHIKIFLKKKNKTSDNMVVNVTKISQKIKNKSLLSIKKVIKEWEKIPYSRVSNRQDFPLINYSIFYHPLQSYSASPLINFGEFGQRPLLFQTPRSWIHVHSQQW